MSQQSVENAVAESYSEQQFPYSLESGTKDLHNSRNGFAGSTPINLALTTPRANRQSETPRYVQFVI